MASRGRMNQERDPRVILALEAQTSEKHRKPRRRASIPKPCSSNESSRFIPGIVSVNADEDILAWIKAYFERVDIRPNILASYFKGLILSAHGEVSNPTLIRQGSPIVFQGIHAIGSFSGWYNVPANGPLELDNLKITIHGSQGQCNAGDVTEPLIAATEVQVIVSWISYVDED